MKSFLNSDHPIITGMLKSKTKEKILEEIKRVRADGAEAFGLQIDNLENEYRTREHLKDIFDAMSDKPVYCTNYKKCDWDTMSEQLIMAIELGATLVDIPADMYDPSDMELSMNSEAITKQKSLVDKIHRLGGEVLISSHVFRYIPKETVMSIAKEHKARGADISKIVTAADSDAELCDNFEVVSTLARDLGIKHLFLCNGTHCAKHRILAPLLGSCMFLTTENARRGLTQPPIAEAIAILKAAKMYKE